MSVTLMGTETAKAPFGTVNRARVIDRMRAMALLLAAVLAAVRAFAALVAAVLAAVRALAARLAAFALLGAVSMSLTLGTAAAIWVSVGPWKFRAPLLSVTATRTSCPAAQTA